MKTCSTGYALDVCAINIAIFFIPAHAPSLTNVPGAQAVASLSVAVVQATAVALATGVHTAEWGIVEASRRITDGKHSR
jgi:hypothetical protein